MFRYKWRSNRPLTLNTNSLIVVIPQSELQEALSHMAVRRDIKTFVINRTLKPEGDISIRFSPLTCGDHPSPGSLPIEGMEWSNWGENLHAMVH